MNFDRAIVLFLASVGAVAGFAPGMSAPRLMAANTAQLKTRVASSLLSETTDAAESDAVVAVDESAGEAAADEEPKEPEFDVSIYVGNISFGKCTRPVTHVIYARHSIILHTLLPVCLKNHLKMISEMPLPPMEKSRRLTCPLTNSPAVLVDLGSFKWLMPTQLLLQLLP